MMKPRNENLKTCIGIDAGKSAPASGEYLRLTCPGNTML